MLKNQLMKKLSDINGFINNFLSLFVLICALIIKLDNEISFLHGISIVVLQHPTKNGCLY
jgi:hypothetical protein